MGSAAEPILVSLDYRGGARFGCDYKHARRVCDALVEAGQPAVLFDINAPLAKTLKQWQTSIFFVLADTFAPRSTNAENYPEPFGLRKALEDADRFYVGSTFAAFCRSSSANKIVARQHLKTWVNLPWAEIVPIKGDLRRRGRRLLQKLDFPLIIKKPFATGSSIGVNYVDSTELLYQLLERYRCDKIETVLAEEFIPGREFTAWVLESEGRPFCYGTEEIHKPSHEPIFTQAGKIRARPVNADDRSIVSDVPRFESPPRVSQRTLAQIEKTAVNAHLALGLRHYSRVDLILRNRVPFVIEVNARPQLRDAGLGYVAATRGEKLGSALRSLIEGVRPETH
jgi:D-alanine-D-alanine ligase